MISEERKISTNTKILLIIFSCVNIFGFVSMDLAVQEFSKTFDSFGTELPMLTRLVTEFHTSIFILLSTLSLASISVIFLPRVSGFAKGAAFYYSSASPVTLIVTLLLVTASMFLPVYSQL